MRPIHLARLDEAVRRRTEQGEIRVEPFPMFAFDAAEAVARRIDLLAVVEHDGQVVTGLAEARREVGEHGVARFHVRGAAAVEQIADSAARQVVGHRHGVEMACEHHPAVAAEMGSAEHTGPAAQHFQVRRLLPARIFDEIGQLGFGTGDVQVNVGGVLLSHTLPSAVPSALEGLATGFGMGPGVPPPQKPPTTQSNNSLNQPHNRNCGDVLRVTQWMRTQFVTYTSEYS